MNQEGTGQNLHIKSVSSELGAILDHFQRTCWKKKATENMQIGWMNFQELDWTIAPMSANPATMDFTMACIQICKWAK